MNLSDEADCSAVFSTDREIIMLHKTNYTEQEISAMKTTVHK